MNNLSASRQWDNALLSNYEIESKFLDRTAYLLALGDMESSWKSVIVSSYPSRLPSLERSTPMAGSEKRLNSSD